MPKSKKRSLKNINTPPGTVVYDGKKQDIKSTVSHSIYSADKIETTFIRNLDELAFLPEVVNWLNVDGLHETDLIEFIGQNFELHTLILEDIVDTHQRTKIEIYSDCIFTVVKQIRVKEQADDLLEIEHIGIVWKKGGVISFQELSEDAFTPLRSRLQHAQGRIRQRGNDYLYYALLDSIVDSYFVVLDWLSNRLDSLEDTIFSKPEQQHLQEIQRNRLALMHMRQAILPMRDALNKLIKDDLPLEFDSRTETYLRDVQDHIIQILETIDTYREINSSLKDIYFNGLSYRMNEIMKVLTIMSTIFIPLTFLAGVYGMNFKFMPELDWKYSYAIFWIINSIIIITLFIYFKRKKWL